ncbi:MAG: DAK2 domain-containing protein [Christensenellaceae bacterium]|jgi:DAK2 domain fusion protein YloV|nr:DAK2 domain-containing protein [Christensenellaceae bacterium]
MITIIDNEQLKKMFKGGATNININREYVDRLNVFPVPDGDTGTNMNLTMVSTINELEAVDLSDRRAVCSAISRGALKGARGNSGVILSQIFKGMTNVLSESKQIDTKVFAEALNNGSYVAYDAVTNPKEGTILTVIRAVGLCASKAAKKRHDFLNFFEIVLDKARETLDNTPNMLDVLKKAGVVDSGGMGLLMILTGMYNALAGIEMIAIPGIEPPEVIKIGPGSADSFFPDIHNLEDLKYAYCTEFFIINLKRSTTLSDIDKLRDRLSALGDCVIVVGDLSLVKVHVHTNNPDKALGFALQLGELDKPKIENMLEQSRTFKKESEKFKKKPLGMVAVSLGEGLKEIFEDLTVDAIIEGGQTMNPSVANIVDVVNSVAADTVFILPNNGNIILAAEQAKELVTCELIIIATKSVTQGIAAALNFNPDCDVPTNVLAMQKAASAVRSGQVTHAVRTTEADGFEVKEGDIIGIYNSIVAKGDDVEQVTIELIEKMIDKETASITLYFGDVVSLEAAEKLCNKLISLYTNHDVAVYFGGQTHYSYFVAVE